jgi:hypothetical protein
LDGGSACRKAYTGKRRHTSMPRVGFEPRTLVSKRANTVWAPDRSATVIDLIILSFARYVVSLLTATLKIRLNSMQDARRLSVEGRVMVAELYLCFFGQEPETASV